MKKLLALLVALTLVLAACVGSGQEGTSAESKKLVIGVSPVPHEEITKIVQEKLASEGIELEIKVFDDYVQPNLALEDGSLDLNFFQHEPYLNTFNSENDTHLVSLGGVHIEPIAFYSTKVKNLDELADGAEILIPADASNGSRALLLLQDQGLIKLKEGLETYTETDIEENSKNLKFTPVEAALIPSTYGDVDGAVINSNYAIDADLNPLKDGLAIETAEGNPYANVIAVKEDRKDDEAIKKVLEAFQSEEVKKHIEEKFNGQIIPAF